MFYPGLFPLIDTASFKRDPSMSTISSIIDRVLLIWNILLHNSLISSVGMRRLLERVVQGHASDVIEA